MKAMILAAGRGERMRPLTDTTPKPLLTVGEESLIGWHLRKLAAAGVDEVIINHAWLGSQIESTLGDGRRYGLRILYSPEATALETAGGLAKARHLLGEAPYIVISADIYTRFDYARLVASAQALDRDPSRSAHIVLAPTDKYQLDFDLDPRGRVHESAAPRYTYANLAVIKPELVAAVVPGESARLGTYLREFAARDRISGEVCTDLWINVGSPADLDEARAA
ncbi:N-acetylmuramate alpha-1-phosphate uridylyltransferase MurU [Chitinimonas sp. BJYL2]|uniref:N-acetylmuramate alpha-1-phosphate uridylyltransferase MurU n=1 Tax=Chitinimonas sp. BJYL2 TaxID=2976696 RepID=UPI0022B4B9E5|nr:nucleotidyltransferase family protein [Chitinimonas sp. BJYL2]